MVVAAARLKSRSADNMSTTDPQPEHISKVVYEIVSKGRENKSLRSVSVFYLILPMRYRP